MSTAAIWVAIIVVRIVLQRSGVKFETRPSREYVLGPLGRRVVATAIAWILGLLALDLTRSTSARWIFIPIDVVLFPAWFSSLVALGLARLGAIRAAYWLCRVFPPISRSKEPEARAALMAARGLGASASNDENRLALVRVVLARDTSFGACRMAAEGVLFRAEGAHDRARAAFRSVLTVPWRRCPAIARETAARFLAVDAASRGEWAEVARIGRDAGDRYARFLGRVAERLMREPRGPSDAALWFFFVVAPHRVSSHPLLRRALATPRAPRSSARRPPESLAELLARASSVPLGGSPAERLVEVGVLAEGLERFVDDPELRARVERRASELGARTSPEAFLARLELQISERLALALGAIEWIPVSAPGRVLDGLAHTRREARLRDLQGLVHAFAQRKARGQMLETNEEWEAWGALHHAYRRAIAEHPDLRESVFQSVGIGTWNHAARLDSPHSSRTLPNAMFRFLLEEAKVVGTLEQRASLARNVKLTA